MGINFCTHILCHVIPTIKNTRNFSVKDQPPILENGDTFFTASYS